MVRARDAQAFVGDFGLSREQSAMEELYNDTGRELPRARYPPEYHSLCEYSTMADVYMFGLLCHELLRLEEPFNDLGDREYELMMRGHLEPGSLPESLPAGVIGITAACLDAEPSARPEMAMVQSVLEKAYAGLYKGFQDRKTERGKESRKGSKAKARSPMFRSTFTSWGSSPRASGSSAALPAPKPDLEIDQEALEAGMQSASLRSPSLRSMSAGSGLQSGGLMSGSSSSEASPTLGGEAKLDDGGAAAAAGAWTRPRTASQFTL